MVGAWLNGRNERRRFKWEIERRYQERSEEAARLLLDLCYRAYEHAEKYDHLRFSPDVGAREAAEEVEKDLEGIRHQVLATMHDLRDESVRLVVERFEYCIGFSGERTMYTELHPRPAWREALKEVVETLGAYRRNEPLPDTTQLREISARLKQHQEALLRRLLEQESGDPGASPE